MRLDDTNYNEEAVKKVLDQEESEPPLSEVSSSSLKNGEEWVKGLCGDGNFLSATNVIPGNPSNDCYPVLRVFFGSSPKENVELRMFRTLAHVTLSCPGKTNLVVLHFAKNPKVQCSFETWSTFEKTFKSLETLQGLEVYVKIFRNPAYMIGH